MCRKFMWCYVFVLALTDISFNAQLTAQGKSHGVSVHETLLEGINVQEWEALPAGQSENGENGAEGAGGAEAALRLRPAALRFGRAALGAAHAHTVRLTNLANTTLHLASVAGTTPDFHASFFHAKALPPEGNTTFSVVYLGRREGPASAHLYIHTSLGVYKYPVSAWGVASEFDVWPLVDVRVPQNASVEPELTLRNPTDAPLQVLEVYSSGAWLGLALPAGGAAAAREAWTVPPHETRALVRLRLRPPPHHHHALTAYVRIKANVTGAAGLVVTVEARAAAAGEHAAPLALRLGPRGARDPPEALRLRAANSASTRRPLPALLTPPRCHPAPRTAPPPDPAAAPTTAYSATPGLALKVLRDSLEPHEDFTDVAQLTFDYAALWAAHGAEAAVGAGPAGVGGPGAWCSGWVRLGRAALPYSLRLLPGGLTLLPTTIDVVTASGEDALKTREVRARNEFPEAVRVIRIEAPPEIEDHFILQWAPQTLRAGQEASVLTLTPRESTLPTLAANIRILTDVAAYSVPLRVYSGLLELEWQWPNSSDGHLRVGVVGTSATRRVGARLVNRAPPGVTLCAVELRAHAPQAALALQGCVGLTAAQDHPCRCVEGGSWSQAWLTLVAPAREGALAAAVTVGTPHARAHRDVTLTARAGSVAAHPAHLPPAAPYAWSYGELMLESTMALPMRVVRAEPLAAEDADPALQIQAGGSLGSLGGAGRWAGAALAYAPERGCAPACYTGLSEDELSAWRARTSLLVAGGAGVAAAWREEAALLTHRYGLRPRNKDAHRNLTLLVHTTQVVQIPGTVHVRLTWPRLSLGSARAGLSGVRAPSAVAVRVRNPSRSHALLLHAALGPPLDVPGDLLLKGDEDTGDEKENSAEWVLEEWRAVLGDVREEESGDAGGGDGGDGAEGGGPALPPLLLAPAAELELRLSFTPLLPVGAVAYLYLRNNLTIMEPVVLRGRGALPAFELAGRAAGGGGAIRLAVADCRGPRRALPLRNTGAVPVRLTDWTVAGAPCAARGFRLAPCTALTLAPNETRALELTFAPDWTVARAAAALRLTTDLGPAEFWLRAAAPARLLPRCAARAPRPPWEPVLRAAGAAAALAVLVVVLAAAALDAERLLRRARHARPPPAAPPLDLRAAAAPTPPAPSPPPRLAPAPQPRRRKLKKPDPLAESRAFERWRAALRRADDDDSRSSEDADAEDSPHRAPADPPTPPTDPVDDTSPEPDPDEDGDPDEPDAYDPPDDGPPADYDQGNETAEEHTRTSGDDDNASTGSSSTADTHEEAAAEATGREPSPRRAGPRPAARPARPAPAPRRPGAARDATRPAARPPPRRERAARRRPAAPPVAAPPPAGELRAPLGPAPGLRAGASWSSVVARSPLPPIGSDVRRRPEPVRPPPTDHSLFYFNGEPQPAGGCGPWRAPAADPPPPPQAFPARDYLPPERSLFTAESGSSDGDSLRLPRYPAPEEPRGGYGAGSWGGAAATASTGAANGWWSGVRPPPGFGAAPAPPPRPFDPFQSLASIWSATPLDWRAPAPPTPPADRRPPHPQ